MYLNLTCFYSVQAFPSLYEYHHHHEMIKMKKVEFLLYETLKALTWHGIQNIFFGQDTIGKNMIIVIYHHRM